MRQRSSVFYNDFYNWMELHKNTGVSFSDTLTYFFNKHNRLEISFCSKLIALIDPSKPIWDRIVTTEHFGIKAPYPSSKNRLQKAICKYEEYCTKYETYMHTPLAESLIHLKSIEMSLEFIFLILVTFYLRHSDVTKSTKM